MIYIFDFLYFFYRRC